VTQLALSLDDKPIVVNLWDGATIKNLLDDAVREYTLDEPGLEGSQFEEVHADTDFKLAICTLACISATIAVVYGFLVPHPASAFVVGSCATGYFVLVMFLTLYSMMYDTQLLVKADRPIEGGVNELLEVESDLARYDYCYSVKITYTNMKGEAIVGSGGAGDPKQIRSAMEGWLISDFFFEDGEFANDLVRTKILDLIAETRKSKFATKEHLHLQKKIE
jgi:hypothetical protein